MFRRLPSTTQTVYSELLERSIHLEARDVLGTAGSGSFVAKTVKGKTYWYLQKSEGRSKRQIYVGPDSETLRNWIDQVKHERASMRDERVPLNTLCGMLVSGGVTSESAGIVKVLEILSEAEVFRLGGVLIGTVAFRALGTVLGVTLDEASIRTDDVDIAQEPNLAVGLAPDSVRGNVAERLLGADEGITPIPSLDPRNASTSYCVRSRDLRLDFLVPARGKQESGPVFLPAFGLSATPLRFLEFLIEAPMRATVVGPRPVLVNVPQPARYALHKIYTSLKRSPAFQAKAAKDLRQASSLIEVLAQDRPHDLDEAWSALDEYPKVKKRVEAVVSRLECSWMPS